MKKYFPILKSKSKSANSQGFALIATITLMVLLALLSIGLLTVAASQTRISEKGILAAEAKAQARLAMEVAIGHLQCELGPDQRISANSGIMDSSPESEAIDGVACPYVLGVWDSWDTWMNRKNSAGKSLTDTYEQGRKELFRRWLISSSDKNNDSSLTAANDYLGAYNAKNERKVQLLGTGTLGKHTDKKQDIYAGLIEVDDANSPRGPVGKKKSNARMKSIAWWVSGENQKVRINLPQYQQDAQDATAVLRATWNTPPPDIQEMEGMSDVLATLPRKEDDEYNSRIQSLISKDTLSLLTRNSGVSSPSALYHDISLDATSLLTDTKFGGLKKDINILFSQEKLPDQFRTSSADVGLRPYSTQDGSPVETTRPIASWNQLYEWANIWNSKGTLRDGQDISSRIQWEGQSPYSLIASDKEPVVGMMDNRYTYMRHPILLKMYSFVGLLYNNRQPWYVGYRGGSIDVLYTVIPVFVWWNPYNVTLKMQGAKNELWGAHFGEHRFMPLTLSTNDEGNGTNDENLTKNYTESVLTPYNNHAYNNRQICDYGSTFRKEVTISQSGMEKGDASVLKPGEIVIYAQPTANASATLSSTYVTQQKEGDKDAAIDSFPLKEGWDQSSAQVRPYGVHIQDGIPYCQFTGDEFKDETHKRKSNVSFAETNDSSKIDFTPDSVILAYKYTDEYTSANKKLGAYVMAAGIMDPEEFTKQPKPQRKSKQQGGSPDAEPYTKIMPAMFNMNWGAWEQKLLDTILYPQEMWKNSPSASEADRKTGKGGSAKPEATFVAYYGISAKWGKSPSVGTYPKGKDYRTKTWQHSSPLFWGSQMIKASELGRTYSPYQFEVKQGTDTDTLSIANVLDNDGTRISIFGGPGSDSISMIVAAELPLHPPYSLAGLAGCRLTPGWYEAGDSSPASIAKRFAYQSGVPGVGLGNSFADPMLPADQIFSQNPIVEDEKLGDFWDHALMANDGVWDTWFASSLSAQPTSLTGGNAQSFTELLKQAFSIAGDKSSKEKEQTPPFANTRLSIELNGQTDSDVTKEIENTENGWEKSARYLRLKGGFNVNSVSSPAWKAIFKGLKNRSILYMDVNGTPQILQSDKNTTYFSRGAIASNNMSHVDDLGTAGVNNGLPVGENTAWSDLRKVKDNQIDQLAKEMVIQVKKRGPFLNMSEFVNRRLSTGEMGIKGALQSAIDKSGINSVFEQMKDKYITPTVEYPNQAAAVGSVYTAAPGYLIQSDILSVLGNILVTRDDTFIVRSYGEVSDKSGKTIYSRAWGEAVVKRGISYVDPTNSPETPAVTVNMTTGELVNSDLSRINKAFGRQFKIVSFRWLSPEEV
ncbi:MAG: hypothetical protein RR250_01730 [Akkermansia sp.]